MRHRLGVRNQRGHDHHGPGLRGDAPPVVDPGQEARPDHQGREPVGRGNGELAAAEEEDRREKGEEPRRDAAGPAFGQQRDHGEDGHPQDAAQIPLDRKAQDRLLEALAQRPPGVGFGLQVRPAAGDEVVAHVGRAVLPAPGRGRGGGEADGLFGDFGFAEPAVPGQGLDRMAVPVAGRKIHPRVDSGRIGQENLIHDARALDEGAPVPGAEQAQGGDRVADRDLIGRLALALLPHQLLDRKALFGQPLLQPAARHRDGRARPGEPLGEFRDERAGSGELGPRHVRHHDHQQGGLLFRHHLQALRPMIGAVAIAAGEGEPVGDPAQIFDQRQPDHDRHGPELPQLERGHGLVVRQEGGERLDLDLRVHPRDELQHEVVDPGEPRGPAVRQAGQLPAVAAGQVPAGQVDLLLDQGKVVENPLGSRGDAPGLVDRVGGAVVFPQQALILGEPGQQRIGSLAGGRAVLAGQHPGMLG